MKTVILAGGLGTRLSEETSIRPKPMVEIGGRPILWHIMKLYAEAGFTEFVVALGYKGEVIKEYFLDYYFLTNDMRIDLSTGSVMPLSTTVEPWTITLVDTGLHTQTGGRIRRLRDTLGRDTFMLTYGDGLADIDLQALCAFHRQHGKLATVTAVRPPARFGAMALDGAQVHSFSEKPLGGEGRINGGFFVLEPGVLDYIDGDETIWERTPLERLAEDGQLMAFQHEGFWHPMDTLRDRHALETLWATGSAPWATWSISERSGAGRSALRTGR